MTSISKTPGRVLASIRLGLAAILFCTPFCSRSQLAFGTPMDNIRLLDSDRFYMLNGKPLVFNGAVEIMEGNPFFKDAWMAGLAQVNDSSMYRGNRVKLNLLDMNVYLLAGDQEQMVKDTVLRLTLTDSLSGKAYHFLHSKVVEGKTTNNHGWYQLLSTGKVVLFAKYKKSASENARFGSAIKEVYIKTHKSYYLYVNGELTEVNKWRDIASLLTGKESAADAFIEKEKLKGRSEDDYVKLIDWYNRL